MRKLAKPAQILEVVEELLQKHAAVYRNCRMKAAVSIVEFEFEGRTSSNRKKNGILSICKEHPEVVPFLKEVKEDKGEGHISEYLTINIGSDACQITVVRKIVEKIPRPYSVNDFELTFDGIIFLKENTASEGVKTCIRYTRSVYGDEKHSYISFVADDANIGDMRKLFFEFAERIPGRYIGSSFAEQTELSAVPYS